MFDLGVGPGVILGELRAMVTAEDIAGGCKYSDENCPLAVAIMRLPNVERAWVGNLMVTVVHKGGSGRSVRYNHSPETRFFVRAFDEGYSMEPFEAVFKRI